VQCFFFFPKRKVEYTGHVNCLVGCLIFPFLTGKKKAGFNLKKKKKNKKKNKKIKQRKDKSGNKNNLKI